MQFVKFEKSGSLASVSLARPDVRNAFHPSMIDELTTLFRDQINRDQALRAVVLKGEGKSFCAGADLGWMKSMVDFTLDENRKDSEKLFEMFSTLRACPIPLIGRVQGHVMGGALGLAAVCDVVAAEDQTQFCFSEVRLGLAPAVISPFVFEKMNVSSAHRYMLSGEIFSSFDALQAGLVHFTGDVQAIDEFVETMLKSFAENGPDAVRTTKMLLRSLEDRRIDWANTKTETTKAIAERRVSREGQEGLRGFLEKTTPSWKGK